MPSQDLPQDAAVDWRPPDAAGDALFGAGATTGERALAIGVGLTASVALVVVALSSGAGWTLLQLTLAAFITMDVAGGVVANGLNSAKRDHFGPASATARTPGGRLVRRPVLFTALHVHAIVVGFAFAPHLWWWGPLWYLVTLTGAVTVRSCALHLERPVALGFCAASVIVASVTPSPYLWGWLPVLLMLKLVLAHAVQEEPYRPALGRPGQES
jgi:hypothetical protein